MNSESKEIHELRSTELLKISNSGLKAGEVVIIKVMSQQFEVLDGFFEHFMIITVCASILAIFWIMTSSPTYKGCFNTFLMLFGALFELADVVTDVIYLFRKSHRNGYIPFITAFGLFTGLIVTMLLASSNRDTCC